MKNLNSNIKCASQKLGNRARIKSWPKILMLLILVICVQSLSLAQDRSDLIKNLPEPLKRAAERMVNKSDYEWPVHDLRVRLFGQQEIRATIVRLNEEINTTNAELFLLQHTIRNEKIKITYKKGNVTKSINWNPATVNDPRWRMIEFMSLIISGKDLKYQFDYDPTTLLIVPPNSLLKLNISYEHTLIFNDTNSKQERIEQSCLVDQDSIISLPVFYESINSNVASETRTKNSDIWYDAQSNSYKLSVAGLTYYEVEKKITAFYHSRVGDDNQVSNITVSLLPEKFLSTVTVNYKRRCYQLRYTKSNFDEFFSDPATRAKIRLRKKFIKGTIFSRPNTLKTPEMREARHHPNRTFKKEPLYPGDIIYLK